jgi:hypothetical protein
MRAINRSLLAIVISGALAPVAVQAGDFGYTYGELRYLDVDLGSGNEADGGTAIGWYRLNEDFFLLGQATRLETDTDVESTTFALGGGYILPLNDTWDAVAIATVRHTELDSGPSNLSDEGYGVQLGVRGMPIPKIETRAFVNYVDVTDSDTSFFVSGDYFFSPSFAAGIAAEFGGDADSISVGIRYAFGP